MRCGGRPTKRATCQDVRAFSPIFVVQQGTKPDTSAMRRSHGFTLVELLVVLVVMAILIKVAVPSFVRQIRSNTMTSNVNSFLADVRFARSEAVRRGGGVVMCRSDSPEATNATCGTGSGPGGNGWVSGWIVFHDKNNNGDRNYNVNPLLDDTILRVQSPISAMDSIVESGGSSSTKLVFTATGRLQSLGSATSIQFGGDLFADDLQRVVCISLGGRARIAGDGTASCGANGL